MAEQFSGAPGLVVGFSPKACASIVKEAVIRHSRCFVTWPLKVDCAVHELFPWVQYGIDALLSIPRNPTRFCLGTAVWPSATEYQQREGAQGTPFAGLSKVEFTGVGVRFQTRETNEQGKAHGIVMSVDMGVSTGT